MKDTKYWKVIDPSVYFENIVIPDDWKTLEDFVDWYLDARMPFMVPHNAEVIRSDDAVAICIFKKSHYQVEFYLEFPHMDIPRHSHPDMEVIIMDLGGGSASPRHKIGLSTNWGLVEKKILSGNEHGGSTTGIISKGKCFLAFQRWDNIKEMSSAAIQWKGTTAGPVQEQLIRDNKKHAFVESGYADVSKVSSNK